MSFAAGILLCLSSAAGQALQLETVFPAGASLGQTVEVELTCGGVEKATLLVCSLAEVQCELIEAKRFRVTVP